MVVMIIGLYLVFRTTLAVVAEQLAPYDRAAVLIPHAGGKLEGCHLHRLNRWCVLHALADHIVSAAGQGIESIARDRFAGGVNHYYGVTNRYRIVDKQIDVFGIGDGE